MKRFEPLAYIRKYRMFIIFLSILSGVLFYLVSMRMQSYTVSAIIQYMNDGAELGNAPDGTEIDTSEIYSVQVMQQVFERMGMAYDSYNLDELRSRVKVERLMTEEEKAVQEAKNSLGEELEEKSSKYLVSFTVDHKDSEHPEAFARQVLDNMLDIYLSSFAEKHINGSAVANNISGLDEGNYDYLEMAELMDTSVTNVLNGLTGRVQGNSGFRASSTGYSFNDLYREFQEIAEIDLPNLYAYILNHKVTKNREVLISKYRSRIDSQDITNDAAASQIRSMDNIISSYVNLMRESGNTEITADYILDNVYDSYYKDGEENWVKPDVTVEYDDLLKSYVSNRTTIEYGIIDKTYSQYIVDLYSGRIESGLQIDVEPSGEDKNQEAGQGTPGQEGGAQEADPETLGQGGSAQEMAAVPEAVDPAEAKAQTSGMVRTLVGRLDEMYRILDETNREYNEYSGAANVGLVSNIVVTEGIRLTLYSCIAVAVFAVLLSLMSVIIGRLADIFDYHAYTDHKFQLPNKLACDRYMARQGTSLLRENVSCVYLILEHVRDKNRAYGVDTCDQMIRKFTELVKVSFERAGTDSFIAMNGPGQFVVFLNGITQAQTRELLRQLKNRVDSYNEAAVCTIEFREGVSGTTEEHLYDIKGLLLRALENTNEVPQVTQKEPEEKQRNNASRQAAVTDEKAISEKAVGEKES